MDGPGFASRHSGTLDPAVRDDGLSSGCLCGLAVVLIVELLAILGGVPLDLQL